MPVSNHYPSSGLTTLYFVADSDQSFVVLYKHFHSQYIYSNVTKKVSELRTQHASVRHNLTNAFLPKVDWVCNSVKSGMTPLSSVNKLTLCTLKVA